VILEDNQWTVLETGAFIGDEEDDSNNGDGVVPAEWKVRGGEGGERWGRWRTVLTDGDAGGEDKNGEDGSEKGKGLGRGENRCKYGEEGESGGRAGEMREGGKRGRYIFLFFYSAIQYIRRIEGLNRARKPLSAEMPPCK